MQIFKDVDEDFVKTLRQQYHKVSDAEFAELLRQHLEDTEKLRKMRLKDSKQMLEKLQQRLRDKEAGKVRENDEEAENSDGEEDMNEVTEVSFMSCDFNHYFVKAKKVIFYNSLLYNL